MKEAIFLFDMDGTVADYEEGLRRELLKIQSPDEPFFDIHMSHAPDWFENRMRLIKKQTNFWLNLPVIEKNIRVLELAEKLGYVLHGLTKGPRSTHSAWSEKLLWCQKNIHPDVDLTVTMDKGLFYGRVLFDDFPPYMNRWLENRPRGLGIMPTTKGNADFNHPNVIKYDGSMESLTIVKDRLKKQLERQVDY